VIPKVTTILQDDTHRLIPSCYSEESVLRRLTDDEEDLAALIDLDAGTNDRLLGEANLLPGISIHELLFGVPHSRIVNASFTYTRPSGCRFNGPGRGAWYAAFEIETARAEVIFHKTEELCEIGWRNEETFIFDDYLADFRSDFHDIRRSPSFADCLNPDSYKRSQHLAAQLLAAGSAGIVYPSVRESGGTCIACFRPALITNVRQGQKATMTFHDGSYVKGRRPRR
jgi:RES domain-containing protein